MSIAVIANTKESFLAICKKYGWQADVDAVFIGPNKNCGNQRKITATWSNELCELTPKMINFLTKEKK